MYFLLPFKFIDIDDKEILVNEVGDYLVVERGTAERIVNREIQNDGKLFYDLHANYFISQSRIPKLIDNLATRYRTKKSFLNDFTSLHIFVMTLRCNQNCEYCQASSVVCNESSYDISYEDLDHAINLMYQSPSPSLTMEFQGGEPTLVPEKLEYAIQKSEELNLLYNKRMTYVLCTNSIELNDKILSICKDYQVLISTSLDGPKEIHDVNRNKEGSYDRVVNGIQKAREALGFDRVSALMTTSFLSLDYSKEIVESYIRNGFTNIFIRALNPYGFARENDWDSYFERFIEFYKEVLDYIIEKNKQGVFFIEDFTALIIRKILTPFPIGFVDLQSPAGIINSVIVYNFDGYVYASDESRMLAENGDYTFRLGKISDSYEEIFYGNKAQNISLSWSTESLTGCADCAFQGYCGADPVRNYAIQNDMIGFRPTSHFCFKHKEIIKHIFSLLIHRKDEVLPIFKSWIA
ncbi:His-Xaa-Ser system radical SAM maturase HxsB [Draconibacterium mangrovi]|uniref:His-Xaa-Ser system radical SAM maturase HxsB n=1 Tax=Draconibacterium mangrovi TaxID=2697469 RepID=UPI0013D5E985|nr:His-Xaa-Ser system radical SAM maturase HxsB [Draconibacterium mangrovi]